MAIAYPNYLDWQARQTVFENLAARMPAGGVLTGGSELERMIGRWVTASFFPTLGVKPQIGRFFNEAEDQPDAERVIVLNYGCIWPAVRRAALCVWPCWFSFVRLMV
jgi:hypothetical protein